MEVELGEFPFDFPLYSLFTVCLRDWGTGAKSTGAYRPTPYGLFLRELKSVGTLRSVCRLWKIQVERVTALYQIGSYDISSETPIPIDYEMIENAPAPYVDLADRLKGLRNRDYFTTWIEECLDLSIVVEKVFYHFVCECNFGGKCCRSDRHDIYAHFVGRFGVLFRWCVAKCSLDLRFAASRMLSNTDFYLKRKQNDPGTRLPEIKKIYEGYVYAEDSVEHVPAYETRVFEAYNPLWNFGCLVDAFYAVSRDFFQIEGTHDASMRYGWDLLDRVFRVLLLLEEKEPETFDACKKGFEKLTALYYGFRFLTMKEFTKIERGRLSGIRTFEDLKSHIKIDVK